MNETQAKAKELYDLWASGCGADQSASHTSYEQLSSKEQAHWAAMAKAFPDRPANGGRPQYVAGDVGRFGDDRLRHPEWFAEGKEPQQVGCLEYDEWVHPAPLGYSQWCDQQRQGVRQHFWQFWKPKGTPDLSYRAYFDFVYPTAPKR